MDSRIGSFFKLLEVGFSPYLGFIPIFGVFLMFELNEAVRGRLIGPKTWDRIDIFFWNQNGAVRDYSTADLDSKLCLCVLNHALIEIGPGRAVKCGFTK